MNSTIENSKDRGLAGTPLLLRPAGVMILTAVGVVGFALTPPNVSAQDAIAPPRAEAVETDSGDQGARTTSSYRLVSADLIAINVFQEPELATQTRIAEDGTIVLPLVGTVRVSGHTVKQAVDTITALYKEDYLVNPVVTVSVLEQTIKVGKLTVLGAVGRAGIVEVPGEGGIPIMEAIAMAGGFSRVASQARVTVKRGSQGKETVFKVNAKDQTTGQEKTFMVYPGDVINVGESIF